MASVVFEGKVYGLLEGESVLDALIRGGADVAFSCKKGSCHTCLLRVVEGEVGAHSRKGLQEELVAHGHFKPCVCHLEGDVVLAPADRAVMRIEAMVAEREEVAPQVVRLSLELMVTPQWEPGQTVELVREDGSSRPYSISSIFEEDYFMHLHVKLVEGGAFSQWIGEELEVGALVTLQGPAGECVYDPAESAGRPLVLVGTGTGAPPLVGVVRRALAQGHEGPIRVVYGARYVADMLYIHEQIQKLASMHPQIEAIPCISGDGEALAPGMRAGRVTAWAMEPGAGWGPEVLERARVWLCGSPDMVREVRCQAVLAGVERAQIVADPFEWAHARWPQDRARLHETSPDPALWEAMGEGPGLRAILEDFYTRTYDDALLSPFFHNVTKARAIDKQYEFLRDVFTGTKDYFGLKPFNAHHWMIISDKLFDYREALFESCLRRHGMAEPMIRRWLAFHEQFRPEIVKSSPRGLIVDGRERLLEGYSLEVLEMGMVCDGCFGEMPEGSRGRLHRRTGQLFCMECGGAEVGV